MAKHDLDNIFTYHAPVGDQPQRYEKLRKAAKAFAKVIIENCHECDDTDTAIRKVREAVMTANAGIAINENL